MSSSLQVDTGILRPDDFVFITQRYRYQIIKIPRADATKLFSFVRLPRFHPGVSAVVVCMSALLAELGSMRPPYTA